MKGSEIMNLAVAKAQMEYRNLRELTFFNIFDIENTLIHLANEGKIWMIQGMKDLAESESILINHYLNEKRELQIYDFVHSPIAPQQDPQ